MFTGCLYTATNRMTGKVYVGQTSKGMESRKRRHLSNAKAGSNLRFHQAIRKYGEDAFEFKVAVVGPKGAWLSDMEKALIEAYGTFGKGYNACAGGPGVAGYDHPKGRKHTDESKAKISATHKKIWAERPSPFLGRKHTPETLEKMSKAQKGKVRSDETRAKLSESHKGKHHAGTFKPGYTHPEETKRKMSETRKGVPKTGIGLENIRRGCAARIGTKASEETLARMSAARLAMPMVDCPHCGKTGRSGGAMTYYHFDNCKKRES